MAYKDKNKRRKNYMKYYFKHPCTRIAKLIRRADKTSVLKPFDIWKLAKKQRCICPLTGRKLTNNNISADHIIHKTNNGSSDIDNIRLVVKEANVARHILTDEAFIKLCEDVVKHNLL